MPKNARPQTGRPFIATFLFASLLLTLIRYDQSHADDTLPGTARLELEGDIASKLVDGVDKFLLNKLDQSTGKRGEHWKRDFSSPTAYAESIAENRNRLRKILGMLSKPVTPVQMELLATTTQPSVIATGDGFNIHRVRWPAFNDVHGEGLLLEPTSKPVASVVAIPHAGQSVEALSGLTTNQYPTTRFAKLLAENGVRVVVPTIVSRTVRARRHSTLSDREYLYRAAFEMGGHLVGYEVQKVLAAVDWMATQNDEAKIGVVGWGDGGMIALYAGALDDRIVSTAVCGYFGNRQQIWSQPIDRNVFGLLSQFGDAELTSMVAPRQIVVEAGSYPTLDLKTKGGAPSQLVAAKPADVRAELERAKKLVEPYSNAIQMTEESIGVGSSTLQRFLRALNEKVTISPTRVEVLKTNLDHEKLASQIANRQLRTIHEIDLHNQRLLAEGPYVRKEFFKNLDVSSLKAFERTVEPYRKHFRDEIVGNFDDPLLPANVRTRKVFDKPKWTGYEVVMDVFPDVIAFGILLLPKDIKEGERRPVVVCQHGLEGRPRDTIEGNVAAYQDFAAKLADRGFITFAPQNLYIFKDRFRTLQRKANPVGKTLFSVIVPQHRQIVDWLAKQSFVDPNRIAFYGLSYGGKSAMRIPPLVDRYCLSICSADFNDWVWKNTSTLSRYSYVWTGEYEIFEFNLGRTFNYSEMAALIAPRPFMVERGHFDGVAPDETVAYEFAKVRFLYQAKLGIGERCEIEWFVGPHTINGKATYDFLHRHLSWPKK